MERCRPELLEFLERSPLTEGRTDRILLDALCSVTERWERIRDHRRTLLETLERFYQLDLAGEGPPAEPRSAAEHQPASEEGDASRQGEGDG